MALTTAWDHRHHDYRWQLMSLRSVWAQQQHSPLTPTWSQVAARVQDLYMTFGGNTGMDSNIDSVEPRTQTWSFAASQAWMSCGPLQITKISITPVVVWP